MDIHDLKEGRDYERHPRDKSFIIAENVSLDQAASLYIWEQPKGLILKRGLEGRLTEAFASHVETPEYPYSDLLKKNDKGSRAFKLEFGDEGLTEVRGVIHFDTYKDRFEKTLPPYVLQDLVELAGVCRRVNVGGPSVSGLYLHDEDNKGPFKNILTNGWHTHPGTTINVPYEGVGPEILLGWEPANASYMSLHEYSGDDLGRDPGFGEVFQAAVGDVAFVGPKLIHRGPQNLPENGRKGFALYC